MNKQDLVKAFLNAVNTWKRYCALLRTANKQNHNQAKRLYGKAMFYWRKQSEKLKKSVDAILFCKLAYI